MVFNKNKYFYLLISGSPKGYSNVTEADVFNFLPGIICDICGDTWASVYNIGPYDIPDAVLNVLNNFGSNYTLNRREFNKVVNILKKYLNDRYPDIKYMPGTRFGPFCVELTGYRFSSFYSNIGEIVVPHKVLDIFQKECIKGFKYYPVKVVKIKIPKNKYYDEKQELFEIVITGRSELNKTQSGVFPADKCKACGRLTYTPFKKLIHDESKWDGSDIFRFDYFLHPIVTEKFKNVCEKYKLTNCEFIPIEDVR